MAKLKYKTTDEKSQNTIIKKTNPTYEIQTSVGLWEEKGPVMAGACGQWANGVGQERQGMARESDCQVVTTQCRRVF